MRHEAVGVGRGGAAGGRAWALPGGHWSRAGPPRAAERGGAAVQPRAKQTVVPAASVGERPQPLQKAHSVGFQAMLDDLASVGAESDAQMQSAVGVSGLRTPRDLAQLNEQLGAGLAGNVCGGRGANSQEAGLAVASLVRTASAEHRLARQAAENETAVQRQIQNDLSDELAATLKEISQYDIWASATAGIQGTEAASDAAMAMEAVGHYNQAANYPVQSNEQDQDEFEEDYWDEYDDYAEAHQRSKAGKKLRAGGGGSKSGRGIYSSKHIRRKEACFNQQRLVVV